MQFQRLYKHDKVSKLFISSSHYRGDNILPYITQSITIDNKHSL